MARRCTAGRRMHATRNGRRDMTRGGAVIKAECTLCSVLRRISDFQRDLRSPLGVRTRCRDCRRRLARTRNGRIRRMLHDARWNAGKAGRSCDITYGDIDRAFRGRCAVTGLPFDMSVIVHGGRMRSPNAPSLDRRDSSKGYLPGNIQVVLEWVNQAKGRSTQRQFSAKLRGRRVGQARHVESWQRRRRRGGLAKV